MSKALRIRWRVKAPGHIRKKLAELARAMPEAFAAGLYQEGYALDALANSNGFVPVDTGRMRATHYVSPPIRAGKKLRVEVGYGTDYAIYVHERREAKHTVGRAGWLLLALAQRAGGFYGRLAARTRQNFEQGLSVDALEGGAPSSPRDPGPRPSRRRLKAQKAAARRRTKRALLKLARETAKTHREGES